jgi:hypothetical protein
LNVVVRVRKEIPIDITSPSESSRHYAVVHAGTEKIWEVREYTEIRL